MTSSVDLYLQLEDLRDKTIRQGYSPSRVVCAANAHKDLLVLGARHFDSIMHKTMLQSEACRLARGTPWEQGFVDQHGNFLTRELAYIIAKENGQIIRECGNPDSQKLYSEHLY